MGGSETATGQGEKESSGKTEDNQSSQKIDTTKMETDAVLEANQNDVDWKIIKYEIENLNQSWSVILLNLYFKHWK